MEQLNSALADDIRLVAQKLGKSSLSRSEYVSNGGRFTLYQIYDGGRTWERWCDEAGVSTKKKEPVPDEVYFERLRDAAKKLGRRPKASERKMFGLNFSKHRYSFKAFMERAEKLGVLESPAMASSEEVLSPQQGVQRVESPRTNQAANDLPGLKQSRPVPPIPVNTRRKKWQRTHIHGFPYAPQDESGVVAIFAILCANGTLPWEILELRSGKGIDATCWERDTGKEVCVELKYRLSKGSWNHKVEGIDYVACWENGWPDFPKPVVVLADKVRL